MVKAVLDTVVFVRCLTNPFGLWGMVVFGRAADYDIIVSEPVTQEIIAVLERPDVARKFRYVDRFGPEAVHRRLAGAEIVRLDAIASVSRDPNDDKFLATAKAGRADFLVTEDADLLVIGTYEGVAIVDAATFLRRLDSLDDGTG